MSRHNYSQYSKKNHQETQVDEIEETVEIVETAEPESVVIEETVEVVAEPKKVIGVVVNCGRLNVRETPDGNAEVVCTIPANSEVEIDTAKSVFGWYSVCTTSGIEGYCVSNFIDTGL